MAHAPQVRIDLAAATPVYRQIVDGIRSLIVDRGLKPGEELPSVRRLAMDLGIHFNTVAEAYRTLAEEGLVDVVHGRAARVSERTERPEADADTVAAYRRRLQNLVAEMQSRGMTRGRVAEELRILREGMKS